MKDVIYLVYHDYELPHSLDNAKFIGAYSTEDEAQAAIERAMRLPGFKDFPDSFIVDACKIGSDHWPSGFVKTL